MIIRMSEADIERAQRHVREPAGQDADPKVEAMVNELIGRVADKWTMLVLEVLEAQGVLRFTQLARLVPGISQKMLTQTLRLYRPQIVRHRSEAYAATAASGSCAARIAAGGRNPCRSISQVSL